LDLHAAVAAVDESEGAHERGLRLDRDHVRAEPTEDRDPVADMGADVEHQVARLHETPIECLHGGSAVGGSLIRPPQTPQAAPPAPALVPWWSCCGCVHGSGRAMEQLDGRQL